MSQQNNTMSFDETRQPQLQDDKLFVKEPKGKFVKRSEDYSQKTLDCIDDMHEGIQIDEVNPQIVIDIEKSYSTTNQNQRFSGIEKNNISADILKDVPVIRTNTDKLFMTSNTKDIDFSNQKDRQIFEDQFFGKEIKESSENQNAIRRTNTSGSSVFLQRKYRYLAYFLAILGIALILIGFVFSFSGDSFSIAKGAGFWILGLVCSVPGIYYSYKILKVSITHNKNENDINLEDNNQKEQEELPAI